MKLSQGQLNCVGYYNQRKESKSRIRAISTGSVDSLRVTPALTTVGKARRTLTPITLGSSSDLSALSFLENKRRVATTSFSSITDSSLALNDNDTSLVDIASADDSPLRSSPLLPFAPTNHYRQSISPPSQSVQITREDQELSNSGSIFQRRTDWSSLLVRLPVTKQNAIHVRLEDDGPYGNDETRLFLLSHFSSLRLTQIPCLLCSCILVIYDRFPLVDGKKNIYLYRYS